MAIKQVARRFCDFCDNEAHADACLLCSTDFCYAHGDSYRPGDRRASRPVIPLCDVCAQDLAAKLRQVIKQAEAGEQLSQREG